MDDLHVRVVVNSTYNMLDQSGDLPFNIVFGIVRRYPNDIDPRHLRFNAKESILDVPYALSCGLLTLQAQDNETGKFYLESIDIEALSKLETPVPVSHIDIPTPVGRKGAWHSNLTIYHYPIDPKSAFASFFKPGIKYKLRGTAGVDLGGHGHKYIPESDIAAAESDTFEKPIRVISKKSDGHALFQLVPSVPWPPKVQTRMHCHQSEKGSNAALLRFVVTNTGTETVSVQTRGRPRFLYPKGPMGYPAMGSEGDLEDPRNRIIDHLMPMPGSNLQIREVATNKLVKQKTRPAVCGLYDHTKYDPRPEIGSLETLEPGRPLERIVDITNLFARLSDGHYYVTLELRGLWWCPGAKDDFAVEGDDRVPKDLFNKNVTPLILECEDSVQFIIQDGQVSSQCAYVH